MLIGRLVGFGTGFAGLLGDFWKRITGMAHIEFFLVAGPIPAGPTFSPFFLMNDAV